jgi:hypothetical protein
MNLFQFLKLSVASCFYILIFSFFRGIAKKLPLSLVDGQLSCKCQYRLSNTLWQLLWRVINTLWPKIRECRKPSGKSVLFAKVANILWGICQRVVNNLWHPFTNLPEGCQYPITPCKKFSSCQQPMAHLQEGCPNCTQKGNLCAIPLKKVKFKVKNQEATNSYKTIRGSSPNKALSNSTTNSPSQSRETVPLNRQ